MRHLILWFGDFNQWPIQIYPNDQDTLISNNDDQAQSRSNDKMKKKNWIFLHIRIRPNQLCSTLFSRKQYLEYLTFEILIPNSIWRLHLDHHKQLTIRISYICNCTCQMAIVRELFQQVTSPSLHPVTTDSHRWNCASEMKDKRDMSRKKMNDIWTTECNFMCYLTDGFTYVVGFKAVNIGNIPLAMYTVHLLGASTICYWCKQNG